MKRLNAIAAALLFMASLTSAPTIAVFADSVINEPPAKPLQLSRSQKNHLLQDNFVVSHSVSSIPSAVKRRFASLSGDWVFQMAEPGQKYQMTDDGQNASLPSRRLIFVAQMKGSCILCYVRGGYAVNQKVVSFRLTAGQAKLDWVADISSNVNTLADVRNAVRARKNVYGDDKSL